MGNYISCHLANSNGHTNTIKLIDHKGKLTKVKLPITAAELMLEQPGFTVSPVCDLRKTGRIVALRADDELVAGKLYMLVTVSKVNCAVSELDMPIIESTFKPSFLLRRRYNKVLPCAVAAPESDVKSNITGFAGHKLGKHRPWKPVLEPIFEGC